MVLKVEMDRFAEEVKARLGTSECYVAALGGGSIVTASHPDKSLILAAESSHGTEKLAEELSSSGLDVRRGQWAHDLEDIVESDAPPVNIGAVAYKSRDQKPGLWVDAFPSEPSPAEVLLGLYNEFRETGELADASFEEFMRAALPNVVILTQDQITRFIQQKEPEC